MSEYKIINGVNGKLHIARGPREDFELFCGYDFMGSVNWKKSFNDADVFDSMEEAKQIIADLEAADEISEMPHLKSYEILVLDDHSNIIHRHYFSACDKDEAYKDAMNSRKKHNGSEWRVIEIKGSLVDYMTQQAETREKKLQKKLWSCMKKALADEDKYGCHLREIALHLGRSIESKETYYDALIDVWCDYFLKD